MTPNRNSHRLKLGYTKANFVTMRSVLISLQYIYIYIYMEYQVVTLLAMNFPNQNIAQQSTFFGSGRICSIGYRRSEYIDTMTLSHRINTN